MRRLSISTESNSIFVPTRLPVLNRRQHTRIGEREEGVGGAGGWFCPRRIPTRPDRWARTGRKNMVPQRRRRRTCRPVASPAGRGLNPTRGFGLLSAGQFTQSGLDLRYFVGRQVVVSVQGNYGQRPGATAMIDRLLDRRRAFVRNAVGGDPSARQLNDYLMVMTTAHMPAIAIQLVLQVLRGPTHIEMMRQR